MWCVADLDEDYIAKMEDVLKIYERPYNPDEPVVCLDEKQVEVYRGPGADGYAECIVLAAPAVIECDALPGVRVDLAALLA